ncbi:MAG: 1-acyl-sn-glycerol-3-phosphate acyltransferase [Verrucomicrobiae bacterium]|nr:1-acyl-sn-glycerol-3-phosphate acyltransferase [Verrucomicrobiae bacterium]
MNSDFYTRLYLWLVAHRRAVLLAACLVAAACVAISSRISLEEDILATLPQNDPIVDEYKYTVQKFRQIDRVFIDVGLNRNDPDVLGRAADEFYACLATNAAFGRITYHIEFGGQRTVVNFLTGALPNLFTEEDARQLAPKLAAGSIRAFLTERRRKLAGPEGMVLKDVVAADPVSMSALVIAKAVPLQTGFGDAHVEDGRLTSSNGCHVLLMAEPKFPSSDSKRSAALVAELLRSARTVEAAFPGTHIAITGGHRMAQDNATLLRGDATRCMVIALSSMFLLCFTAYRRRWLAVVTFLPSLFGTLIAGTVLVLWTDHVSAIAVGFASMAIGITVDYGIYVVYHLDNAAADRLSAGKIVGRLLLPTAIGALTIIAAFTVLATSPMRGYQQLGVFGAVGVLMAASFALFVLPLLVPLPKNPGVPKQLRFTNWMESFHAWQKRKRPLLLLGVAALTVVAIIGVKRLRFEGDISKLNGITQSTREDDDLIRNTWGDALGMTLVVARGKTPDEALAQNDRAAALLAAQTNVIGVYSLAAICPSLATQAENIKRWQNFWTPERKESLHQTLQSVGGELGFRPDAFAPFWKTVEEPPAPITLDLFRGTALEQVLNERVAAGTNDTAVSTLIKLGDREQAGRLRDALPGFILIDQKNFAEHIAALAKGGMGHFALWTVIAVGAIVYLTLSSIELILATLLPIGFGLLWTLGFMGLLGLPINVMNCVFVIFVIGMGEDYSVFLATSKLDEWHGHPPRIHATSASVLISAATTIFGFAVLIMARHPVLFSMGTTVLLGMISAFIATLVITPACMDLLLFKPQPCGAPRWWHLLGTVWAGLYLVVSQTIAFGLIRPVLKKISPNAADRRIRKISRAVMAGLVKSIPFSKLTYQNFSPDTLSRPAIVISNHQSASDVLVAFVISSDLCMTVKKRVYDTPILGIACKCLGHVVVEASQPAATLARCRERLDAGLSLHFFPEGTRSTDGFLQRFHRGAFELAVELQRDILPVVLCDTHVAMPRDAYWFEPGQATVRALPRVTPQNFDYSLGSAALMQHCEQLVRASLQQQLDELNTPRTLRRKVERLYRYQGPFTEKFAHFKLKLDPVFPALDPVVPRTGFILDLGCGYGLATHWLAECTDQRTFLGVDYDEEKIRVARRTAPNHARIKFETGDILEMDYPPCDAVLLLDVLHYWVADKQQKILEKARHALRPGGKLILRDGAKAQDAAHKHIHRWEVFATKFGLNHTREGLHFQTLAELQAALKRAGFTHCELIREAGRGSNVLLVASV